MAVLTNLPAGNYHYLAVIYNLLHNPSSLYQNKLKILFIVIYNMDLDILLKDLGMILCRKSSWFKEMFEVYLLWDLRS